MNVFRYDVQGLRGIAVLAVIAYHYGLVPNGFLGVDVFFVISGYVVTKSVFSKDGSDRFDILPFYLRRIRRILPLVTFVCLLSLFIGMLTMLPDDLENLSQSVVASLLFSNNYLLLHTSVRYWEPVNDYKPLMHTWSLGIEEQFYILYPIFINIVNRLRSNFIIHIVTLITLGSALTFAVESNTSAKFYLIQYRAFEISIGCLVALISTKLTPNKGIALFALTILCSSILIDSHLSYTILVFLAVFSTAILIGLNPIRTKWDPLRFSPLVLCGEISFSLYLWHQVVLAFTRYHFYTINEPIHYAVTMSIIVLSSILSYKIIEQPFRSYSQISNKSALFAVFTFTIGLIGLGLFLNARNGVIRDVNELNISLDSNTNPDVHKDYNLRIHQYDKPFSESERLKVLVIGTSFARDFANVLLESKWRDSISISYIFKLSTTPDKEDRFREADYIYFSELEYSDVQVMTIEFNLDTTKIWNIGTKTFGEHIGLIYRNRKQKNYCLYKIHPSADVRAMNDRQAKHWGSKYINMIEFSSHKNDSIPVFTDDCKLISHDCRHLTQSGATHLANQPTVQSKFKSIFETK